MNDYCKITVENVFHVLAQLQIFNQDAAWLKKGILPEHTVFCKESVRNIFKNLFIVYVSCIFFGMIV